jgi:tRNA (cytidine/uridine-2'-O-)-methyltransferase
MKIVLYQPDIAQNLGAALRLCACFGVELEIIEPCGFPLTSKDIRRTAMDYGTADTVIRHKNWQNFKNQQIHNGSRTILLSTKATTPLPKFKFRPDDVLLFGRESAGVPTHVFEDTDAQTIIPLAPNARSFNLVSSASISLFEALRQTDQLYPLEK